MTKVQFLNVKSLVSFNKDFEVEYRIYSSTVKASKKHYIALCCDWTCILLECKGKTVLEQEGITVKSGGNGKVKFTKQDLQKLSDGRKYYLLCRDEDGRILGGSRPFEFCSEVCKNATIGKRSTKGGDKLPTGCTSSYTETKNITNSSPNSMKNIRLQHTTLKEEILRTPSIIRKYEQLKSLLLTTSITLAYTVNMLSDSMQDVKMLVNSFTTQLQKLLADFDAVQGS